METDGRIWERIEALRFAANLHQSRYLPADDLAVLTTAETYFNWIISPTRLRVTFGPVIDKETGEVVAQRLEGHPMQLLNTQKVTGRVNVIDRGGEDLPDNPDITEDDISVSIDDPAVATVESSAGGREFTISTVATGTAIFTLTLGDKVFTEGIDVLHSEADRLEVQFDEPVDK
jgi:hypothetical protein